MASVAGTIVLIGSFDTKVYADDLPDSFSETETRGGFTVYEESEGGSHAIAIGNEMLVIGLNGLEEVVHILNTKDGDVDRLVEGSLDNEWMLETVGSHTFVSGTGRDSETQTMFVIDPFEETILSRVDTDLLVSGASIGSFDDGITSASSDLTLTHTTSPFEQSEIANIYTESEADVTVSVSGADRDDAQRVSISADFSERSLRHLS